MSRVQSSDPSHPAQGDADDHARPLRDRLSQRGEFRVPAFEEHYKLGTATCYAFDDTDCRDWYAEFAHRISRAVREREFLPVYRMGDGEYIFALGAAPEDRLPLRRLTPKQMSRRLLKWVLGRTGGHRSGSPEYGFEQYTRAEAKEARQRFVECLREIADKGILALGLDSSHFYNRFYPAILDWFDDKGVTLNRRNFYHVYFVYALLHGPDRAGLLSGRRVAVVTGLDPKKKAGIESGLRREGAADVQFMGISRSKSMLEKLDLSSIERPVDLVLVGAGIGSANILVQLEPLETACIDVGFALSTLAEPELRWNRPFCVPDDEWDVNRVRFLPVSR